MRQPVLNLVNFVLLIFVTPGLSAGAGVIESVYAPGDAVLSAAPNSAFWKGSGSIEAPGDNFGRVVPGHSTTIRSRWTQRNLYLLFSCPYEKLWLKPHPDVRRE